MSGRSCGSVTDPKDPDAADCVAQMNNYKDYAWSEPQICTDRGYAAIREFVLGSAPSGQSVSFVLTNCSTGSAPSCA